MLIPGIPLPGKSQKECSLNRTLGTRITLFVSAASLNIYKTDDFWLTEKQLKLTKARFKLLYEPNRYC